MCAWEIEKEQQDDGASRTETDEVLYRRFLDTREEENIRYLLERHREGLTLFLFGYVKNMEDAEELMLDTFAEVVSGNAHFRGKSSFKTWLFGIGRHLALHALRKNRIRTAPIDDRVTGHSTDAELALLKKEKDRQIYLALDQLKEEYRQVLYLLYFEELDADAAAAVMKKNRRQIYNLTARGKKELKTILEKMGIKDAYD